MEFDFYQYSELFDKAKKDYINSLHEAFNLILENCKNTEDIEEVIMIKYRDKDLYTGNLRVKSLKIVNIKPYVKLGQIVSWRGSVIIDADSDNPFELFNLFSKTKIRCDYDYHFSEKIKNRKKEYSNQIHISMNAKNFPTMKDHNEKTLVWDALSNNNLEGKIIELS